MALASNALTSVASLEAYMRRPLADSDLFSIYHDESASATAATVEITDISLVLIITGGGNDGTQTLTLSDSATITALKTVIDTLSEGWVVRVIGSGNADPTRLLVAAATTGYGSAAELFMRGVDTYAYQQAINAASDRIARWCGRTFASATYRQLYNGTDRDVLRLREFPVTAVSRVAVGRVAALQVKNTSSDAKMATVSNDLTNLTLTIGGGTNAGSDTVAISTNTVTQLVAAIIALGKNWTATVASSTAGNWLGTELFKHEALACLTTAVNLYTPAEPEEAYRVDLKAGILRRSFGTDPWFQRRRRVHWPAHVAPLAAIGGDIWPEGQLNVYVNYTAGYSTIPLDLEMLCNELAATVLRAGSRDAGLTSESVGSYSYSAHNEGWMPGHFRERLNMWRSLPPFPVYVDV